MKGFGQNHHFRVNFGSKTCILGSKNPILGVQTPPGVKEPANIGVPEPRQGVIFSHFGGSKSTFWGHFTLFWTSF